MTKVKIGHYIVVKNIQDETNFKPLVGRVIHIENARQIHGTWSRLTIIPEANEYEVLPESRYELFKLAVECQDTLIL